MQISIPIDDFSSDKVLFCNRTENTVISGGGFYRVMYCDKDVTMLGVHITFSVDMTMEDSSSTRLDVREALSKITPRVMDVVGDLSSSIHSKWRGCYVDKPIAYPVTSHSVEPAILKALLQARNEISARTERDDAKSSNGSKLHGNVIKMPFVFKCAGVFDTDDDAGVSFRLNSVTHL